MCSRAKRNTHHRENFLLHVVVLDVQSEWSHESYGNTEENLLVIVNSRRRVSTTYDAVCFMHVRRGHARSGSSYHVKVQRAVDSVAHVKTLSQLGQMWRSIMLRLRNIKESC